MKFRVLRLVLGPSWKALNPTAKCPHKGQKRRGMKKRRCVKMEAASAVIGQNQEQLNPRKPGEAGRTLSGSLQRAQPCDTSISDFWPEN